VPGGDEANKSGTGSAAALTQHDVERLGACLDVIVREAESKYELLPLREGDPNDLYVVKWRGNPEVSHQIEF
jgi:hypothetical protein